MRFFFFGPEIPFLGKLGPKIRIVSFKLKFAIYTNRMYSFLANLIQKIKIVSLS